MNSLHNKTMPRKETIKISNLAGKNKQKINKYMEISTRPMNLNLSRYIPKATHIISSSQEQLFRLTHLTSKSPCLFRSPKLKLRKLWRRMMNRIDLCLVSSVSTHSSTISDRVSRRILSRKTKISLLACRKD